MHEPRIHATPDRNWQASCSCGWQAPERATVAVVKADINNHLRTTA